MKAVGISSTILGDFDKTSEDSVPHDRVRAPRESIPAHVERAARAARLGRPLRVFQPKHRNWALLAFMFLIGLLLACLVIGLWLIWEIIKTPNLSKSRAARRIYLYEHGFVLVERPEDPQVFPWDAIDTVFQKIVTTRYNGINAGTKYLYTITRRDGVTTKLTLFWDEGAQLGAHVNERVSAALLPGAMAAIERGRGIQFGDMTLTRRGIEGKHGSVTWAEVSGIRMMSGYVHVQVRGRRRPQSTAAAASLPNLPLFLTLTDRLRQAGRTGPVTGRR
jgi:hypothetical protein